MLTEQEIADELRQYGAFQAAYREGMRGDDLPDLPKQESALAEWKSFVMFFVGHPLLAVLWKLSQITRVYKASVFFAKTRINTDKYSFEPCSCGLNQAYTRLGLALLKKKDVAGAIDCLAASWRVHPCPHSTSFGLAKRLALALRPYPEAAVAVQQYVRMGERFAMSSSWWPTDLP
jgi:hypothetical protein